MSDIHNLHCTGYTIHRSHDGVPRVDVEFLLRIHPQETETIADALKEIELRLAHPITLVRSPEDGKVVCFYCARKNKSERETCSGCGAVM